MDFFLTVARHIAICSLIILLYLCLEVELITLMDQNGIGTDATIATHISTIQNREYAKKDGQQKFHPTTLGIALIEAYNRYGFGNLCYSFWLTIT
jgi:DNA topoisomerase IA